MPTKLLLEILLLTIFSSIGTFALGLTIAHLMGLI